MLLPRSVACTQLDQLALMARAKSARNFMSCWIIIRPGWDRAKKAPPSVRQCVTLIFFVSIAQSDQDFHVKCGSFCRDSAHFVLSSYSSGAGRVLCRCYADNSLDVFDCDEEEGVQLVRVFCVLPEDDEEEAERDTMASVRRGFKTLEEDMGGGGEDGSRRKTHHNVVTFSKARGHLVEDEEDEEELEKSEEHQQEEVKVFSSLLLHTTIDISQSETIFRYLFLHSVPKYSEMSCALQHNHLPAPKKQSKCALYIL